MCSRAPARASSRSFGIIRDEFPREKLSVAVGVMSAVVGAGGGLGLVSSGFILEHLGWHWLFLVGAGPALAAAVLIWLLVPESPVRHGGRPDWLGALTLSIALVALLSGVTKGEAWGWTSGRVLGLVVVSVAWFAAWIAVERRVASPMVDLKTFTRRGMAATNAATLLVGFSLTAFFVLMPAFVQVGGDAGYGFGASAVDAGLFFVPCSLAMIACGPLAGAFGARAGHVLALQIGLAVSSASLVLLAFVHQSPGPVLVWLATLGVGLAFALSAIGSLVIANSQASETGVASGVNLITRIIGAAVGAQVAAAVISAHTTAGSLVPGEAGFTWAFGLAAGLALLPQVTPLTIAGFRADLEAAGVGAESVRKTLTMLQRVFQRAVALEWRHVRRRTLVVEQALSDGRLKALKNRRSPRVVPLLPPLHDDLEARRVAVAGRAPVVPTADGGFWRETDRRNWRRRTFRPAARAAGWDDARPYDLRHAFASLLIAEGRLSIVEIAAQLGHTPTVCLDIDGHEMAERGGERVCSAAARIVAARARVAQVLQSSHGGRVRA